MDTLNDILRRATARSVRETKRDLVSHARRTREYERGVCEKDIPSPIKSGHCDLCERPTVKLFWDHDHILADQGIPRSQTHRGWLCFHCNTGLGKLGDTPEALARAYAYVKRNTAEPA